MSVWLGDKWFYEVVSKVSIDLMFLTSGAMPLRTPLQTELNFLGPRILGTAE